MQNKLSRYVKFYKLARQRARSGKDSFKFEAYQARMVVNFLERRGINFKNLRVLDLGSGRGGYSYEFVKKGAEVISVDIENVFFQKIKHVNYILGDARKLPFKESSFDFIFSSSMIEHIKNQESVIKELSRVVKKKGLCYLSFPPFWSPVGAHQFKPFHYFGEKLAIKLSRKFYKVRSFKYDDKYGKLYITKIRDVKKLIKKTNLQIKDITTRYLPLNFAKIPILNEFLTWHVEFLIEKK